MENTNKPRRAFPVKLVWMLVTLGIFLVCLSALLGAMGGRFNIRNLGSGFQQGVPYMLIALAMGLCLARGSINLSVPGTVVLCSLVFGASLQAGLGFAAALPLTLLTGAGCGALCGLFAIQRRRNVLIVTALSSLAVGVMASGLARGIALQGFSLPGLRGTEGVLAVSMTVVAVGMCFVGAIGGRKLFRTFEGEAQEVGGGGRFLWSVIAGALAALAAVVTVARMSAFMPSTDSDGRFMTACFILLTAGILLPNRRRSYSEALFGFLSVVIAACAYGMLNTLMLLLNISAQFFYVIYGILALLMVLPNLLVCSRPGEPETP